MTVAPSYLAPADSASVLPLPEDLERAHDQLGQCALLLERIDTPPIDLTAAAKALELTFDRIFASQRAVEDPAQCLPAARAALDEFQSELARNAGHNVLALVSDLASNADRNLAEAELRLRAAPWSAPARPPELAASERQLRLHQLERPNLVAQVRVAPPIAPEVQSPPLALPAPTTFEELEAAVARLREQSAARAAKPEPPETPATTTAELGAPPAAAAEPSPFVSDAAGAWSRQRFVEERATGAFEEVLLAWIQRSPIAGERWQSARFIEHRLFAGVDALAALGPLALKQLEALTLGNPTRTPAHLAALALALGCVDGRDTLALAERLLYEQESAGPEWADAFAAALALVPHLDATRLALRFAQSQHANHRAFGLRVLLRRGVFDRALLARAVLDEPVVANEALPTYAALTSRDEARSVLDGAFERSASDPAMRQAALRALSAGCHMSANARLFEAFQSQDDAEAGILLAQASGRSGTKLLVDWVAPRPSAAGAQALGWTGSVEAVPVLIAALGSADEAVQAASAEALERITGAGLQEDAEIPPERVLNPDVPDPVPDDGPSLAQKLSPPHDQPSSGSPDRIQRITRDPARWRAWWLQNGTRWDPALRYRRGYPWSPHVVWTELCRAVASPGDRRRMRHELTLFAGAPVLCDPADLVGHQELVLTAYEPTALAVSRSAPGGWSEAQRR
ncbi:MAG TPA: hypothetical protein VGI10_14605 [Polyangiaceae bacterium]|jgi:hypothetical protein